MSTIIVHSLQNVTLVGGGFAESSDITETLNIAPILVAADGGARKCLDAGATPVAVIGDMDSLDDASRARLDPATLHQIDEQNSTDFDKALRSIDAPMVLAIGFTGNRLDHELAALSGLFRYPDRRCIMLGDQDIVFHCPPNLAIDLDPGARVSLFPLTPMTGTSHGLRWPIDGRELSMNGLLGTSNEATGGVELRPAKEGCLIILPRDCLNAAIAALLLPSSGSWSAL